MKASGWRIEYVRFVADCTVESELHVLFNFKLYSDLRDTLFAKALSQNPHFMNLSDCDKFAFLFSNLNMIRICAKICFLILQRRQFSLCK